MFLDVLIVQNSGFGGQGGVLWEAYSNIGFCFFVSIDYDGV